MGIHLPIAVAGLLIMAPAATMSLANAQPDPQLTGTQLFSAIAGKVVGAASACDDINADRISLAASRAALLVSVSANDDTDVATSQELFSRNDDYGRSLVRSGRVDCGSAEISLASLEEVEKQ
jgi:hypothetical protein